MLLWKFLVEEKGDNCGNNVNNINNNNNIYNNPSVKNWDVVNHFEKVPLRKYFCWLRNVETNINSLTLSE